jgi:hypothetical protein
VYHIPAAVVQRTTVLLVRVSTRLNDQPPFAGKGMGRRISQTLIVRVAQGNVIGSSLDEDLDVHRGGFFWWSAVEKTISKGAGGWVELRSGRASRRWTASVLVLANTHSLPLRRSYSGRIQCAWDIESAIIPPVFDAMLLCSNICSPQLPEKYYFDRPSS